MAYTYKGYVATVEYDDSVGMLHGSVVNSGKYPIATFEATDVESLRAEFHRSIDEYLASCGRGRAKAALLREAPVAVGSRPAPACRCLSYPERHEYQRLDQAGFGGAGGLLAVDYAST